eukprot:PhF_6_TR2559/c0_g1_i1/m.4335
MDQLLDASFAILPTTGYWAQLHTLVTTRNTEGFSIMVSLILIISNTLRCIFWVLKRFDDVLLYQALIMLVVQFGLLYTTCSMRPKYTCDHIPTNTWLEHNHLNTFKGTVKLWGFLILSVGAVSFVFSSVALYVEFLGLISVVVEATLALPQIIRNHTRHTTDGLSYILVFTWVFGDTYKLGFCLVRGYPVQFVFCAVVQLLLDFVVMNQIRTLPSKGPIVNNNTTAAGGNGEDVGTALGYKNDSGALEENSADEEMTKL